MRVVSHPHVSNADQSSSNLHAFCAWNANPQTLVQICICRLQGIKPSSISCLCDVLRFMLHATVTCCTATCLLCSPVLLSEMQASTLQVQQAKDTLSEERHSHQDSQQALESSQQLLAAASGEQQQLRAQVADLQLQLQGSTAEHSHLQVAISAADVKLSASEADLASTHSQVGYSHFCVLRHTTHSLVATLPQTGSKG